MRLSCHPEGVINLSESTAHVIRNNSTWPKDLDPACGIVADWRLEILQSRTTGLFDNEILDQGCGSFRMTPRDAGFRFRVSVFHEATTCHLATASRPGDLRELYDRTIVLSMRTRAATRPKNLAPGTSVAQA